MFRKIPKYLTYFFAFAAALYFSALVYILSFSLKPNIPEHADAILVLGAKVNLDNSPSDPLYERTNEAVKLYAQNKAEYIITTGGVGLGSIPEASISALVAEEKGVPKEKILKDQNSHNTFQNVDEGRKIAKEYNIKSVIVISDRYHVARGVLVARHLGFSPVYWDYPDFGYYKKELLLQNYAREAAAILFYLPKIYLTKALY